MSNLLSVQDLSAGYGGKPVVKGVSFDVSASECCGLLGLNGSGKTTLLKSICGLLPISGGGCYLNGIDCSKMNEKARARSFSYMPQRLSKLIGVTVFDVVMMGLNPQLGLLEYPSESHKAGVQQALDKIGIPHLAGDDFSRLSEGQKQLVILARSLVQNAPVMMLDEPDSALDFINKHKTLKRIRRLIRDEGKTALVTLHDPNLALAYCDRLILLQEGKVVSEISLSQASAEEVRSCLATIYGEITLLEHDGKLVVLNKTEDGSLS